MKKSIWPWIALLLLWILGASYLCKHFLCGPGASTGATKEATTKVVPPVVEDVKKTGLGAWTYADGTGHKANAPEHFRFDRSGFNHLAKSAGLTATLGETAEYLKSHPDRSINVTGYYHKDEKNGSVLPNLGLARANDVSKYLTSLGVAGSQITTDAKMLQNDWFEGGNILKKGIDFTFHKLAAGTGRIDDIKKRLLGKPLTLYFGTNQDNIALSGQQRKDFADLLYYLDNVPTSKLNISGHTDTVGNRDYNVNLSRNRAEFVAGYLTKNGGVGKSKMSTRGFGPDKPVASNATADGRAKNRRVEVTLR